MKIRFAEHLNKYVNFSYFDDAALEIKEKINERLLDLYNEVMDIFFASDKRYLILFGGRSSGKTDAVTSYLFKKLVVDGYRSVILRSSESSLKSTNHEIILDLLDSMGILQFFKLSKTPFTFRYGRSKLTLLGLKREDIAQGKIKSFANTHVFVFEEADLFNSSTFETAEFSLRGYNVGKIILVFNPPREGIHHWIYKSFFPPDYKTKHEKFVIHEDAMILHTSYKDCPFNPPGLIKAMERSKERDKYEYDRVVLGNFTFEKTMRVYPKYEIVDDLYIFPDSLCTFGVDWGFRDTMAVVKCWFSPMKNLLFIEAEYGKEGLDPEQVADFLLSIPGITQYKVYADNSNPAMIKLLRPYMPITAVKKLTKSILNGIFRIRSMDIKVSSKCQKTIEEFGMYEWKPHKTDEKLADTSVNPKDMFNHFMDAMRYALDGEIADSPSFIDLLKEDY